MFLLIKKDKLKKKKGYVTLISLLVIGAVGLAVATSLILTGVGSSRTSFSLEQSNQAKALANACVEEALQRIWILDTFTGTGNLTLGQGSCSYSVTSATIPKTITASGVVGTLTRRVAVTIDALYPYLSASSWQEVAN